MGEGEGESVQVTGAETGSRWGTPVVLMDVPVALVMNTRLHVFKRIAKLILNTVAADILPDPRAMPSMWTVDRRLPSQTASSSESHS